MPIEVLVLLGLILINGVFAMSEIALGHRAQGAPAGAGRGGRSGRRGSLALNDEPTRFLSTIQVGITSIGILSGIVGEAAFAAAVEPLADPASASTGNAARLGATVLVVVIVTYVSIVIGELVPKRLGQIRPKRSRGGWRVRSVAGLGGAAVRALAVVDRPTCC